MDTEKLYAMPFSNVYPLLVAKAQRKNRSADEVAAVTAWLTGYSPADIAAACASTVSYGDFFRQAPRLHPLRLEVRGRICGVRIEDISEPLLRDIRILDKLIDDLAKGKPLEKILPKD